MPESTTDKDQARRAEPRTELSRDLGCFDITMIGGTIAQRVATSIACPVVLVSQRSGAIAHSVQSFFEFFRDREDKAHEEAAAAAPATASSNHVGGDCDESRRS